MTFLKDLSEINCTNPPGYNMNFSDNTEDLRTNKYCSFMSKIPRIFREENRKREKREEVRRWI